LLPAGAGARRHDERGPHEEPNIAELRANLSELHDRAQAGEEIEIRKRNVPIARIVPVARPEPNRTRLGCGRGSVTIRADLTEPVWSAEDWEMLGGKP
jgi:prevent-host-death family protein